MEDAGERGAGGGRNVPPRVTYAVLALLLALLALMALWEYLTTLYLLAIVAWLVLAGGLLATDIPKRLLAMEPIKLLMVLFLGALAVRSLMLLQGDVITRDIEMFAGRGQLYLDGAVPYTSDFGVNKPPAYLYLAGGMAAAVGPWTVGFRALMGVADALVAVMLYMMARERFSPEAGVMAGVLYAINPISAVSVGISGHYDPVVVLFAMGGIWLAMRGRRGWASLSLGVGFALKLYPAVLIPWVLLEERTWRRRAMLATIFVVPMVLSWLPVLSANPDALSHYVTWQGDWIPKKGIAWGLAMALGWTPESTGAGNLATVVEYAFLALLAVMFLDWVRRRQRAPDDHLADWFKVVTAGFYLLYGCIFVGSVMDYRIDLGLDPVLLGAIVAVAYFPAGAVALWWLWRRWLVPAPSFGSPDERTVMLMALSVTFLLLSSAQYNPWYLLWLLPLVLMVQSWRVRDIWNALLVWNVEGLGISLWPGLGFNPPPTV
jgi:hypothetical protein